MLRIIQATELKNSAKRHTLHQFKKFKNHIPYEITYFNLLCLYKWGDLKLQGLEQQR